ncbi:hypothetical protein C0081_13125 [Cohaesibacter celericrescens]|uniref:Uncharacterized protein n=1 Tax=Cohaesibacter celericrescens TaxID=2067669 RepID=A0A2N5XR99_9HYPH|nr:hypothetical protein C0081_13125 [Cohaesibacter celericrescens]
MAKKTIALEKSAGLRVSARCQAHQTPSAKSYKRSISSYSAKPDDYGGIGFDEQPERPTRHGEKVYDRRRDLPGLLHLFPAEIDKLEQLHSNAILKRIVLALRGERSRGRTGHWRYSLARHIGLKQAFMWEKMRHTCSQPPAAGVCNKKGSQKAAF